MNPQVYFAASSGRIKIGTTARGIRQRLKTLSARLPEPLMLIGHISGGTALEHAIQLHLIPYRLSGEWFRDCDDVRNIIRILILRGPSGISPDLILHTHSAKPAVLRPLPKRANPGARKRIIAVLWPDDPLNGFAAYVGSPPEMCRRWIDEECEMPWLVRCALAVKVVQFAGSES